MKAVLVCAALALVDTAGTYFAVTASRGSRLGWILGIASFVLLFVILVAAVQWANLTGVILGWIVLVQIGAIVIDMRVYGTRLPPMVWIGCAIALIGLTLAMSAMAPQSQTATSSG